MAKNTFGGSPEPPQVSGGAPCRTDMDCIERFNHYSSKFKARRGKAQYLMNVIYNSKSSILVTHHLITCDLPYLIYIEAKNEICYLL